MMIFIDNIMIEGNIYKRRNIKMMILNTISIQVHNDINCCSFIDFFLLILKIIFLRHVFLQFTTSINVPWDHLKSHKNFGPIGSAVFTFIGQKQTNKHTKKQISKVYIKM